MSSVVGVMALRHTAPQLSRATEAVATAPAHTAVTQRRGRELFVAGALVLAAGNASRWVYCGRRGASTRRKISTMSASSSRLMGSTAAQPCFVIAQVTGR